MAGAEPKGWGVKRAFTIPHKDFLPFIGKPYDLPDGRRKTLGSQRYRLIERDGPVCVSCGIEGEYWACESHAYKGEYKSYHFNLYGVGEHGNEVLITKDHIVPKSKGGKNCLDNYQVMCYRCNQKKGDRMPWNLTPKFLGLFMRAGTKFLSLGKGRLPFLQSYCKSEVRILPWRPIYHTINRNNENRL